jgi:hypothetical protein
LPPPSYIRSPLGGELDTRGLREFLWRSSPLPLMRISSPLSLMWLPKGLRRREVNSTAAHRRAAVIPDLIQTNLLPQSQLDQRDRKKSSFTVCVRVLGGAALVAPGCCARIVAPVSWCRDLHDLQVGYADFIINACAGP